MRLGRIAFQLKGSPVPIWDPGTQHSGTRLDPDLERDQPGADRPRDDPNEVRLDDSGWSTIQTKTPATGDIVGWVPDQASAYFMVPN